MNQQAKIDRYTEILKDMSLDDMLSTYARQQAAFSATYDDDCATQMTMIRAELQNRIDA